MTVFKYSRNTISNKDYWIHKIKWKQHCSDCWTSQCGHEESWKSHEVATAMKCRRNWMVSRSQPHFCPFTQSFAQGPSRKTAEEIQYPNASQQSLLQPFNTRTSSRQRSCSRRVGRCDSLPTLMIMNDSVRLSRYPPTDVEGLSYCTLDPGYIPRHKPVSAGRKSSFFWQECKHRQSFPPSQNPFVRSSLGIVNT